LTVGFAVEIHQLHSWDLSPAEAIALQRELAGRVHTDKPLKECRLIAGADVSYERGSDLFYAGVVVVNLEDFSIVERRAAQAQSTFPYVPGLLSFREAPVLLEAFRPVTSRPDLIICDGQGSAHPRRLGLASHVGLWLDVPCAGCAKSKLTGRYTQPAQEPGSRSPLLDKGEVIGAVLRTKAHVKPVFVSPGNNIDLGSSVRWVLACCRGYRLPEATRLAHLYVNEVRTEASGT
jgi:deoxyribonuclease V